MMLRFQKKVFEKLIEIFQFIKMFVLSFTQGFDSLVFIASSMSLWRSLVQFWVKPEFFDFLPCAHLVLTCHEW